MRFPIKSQWITQRGSSMIETIIAMGVLAVAIPLVFGALAESGKSGMSSEAETRSSWIIPTCLAEVQASREGKPQYFTPTTSGQKFPSSGDVWALGFTHEGKPIGKISKSIYDQGAKELQAKPMRYIATISSEEITATPATTMLRVKISLEYPSSAPVEKRQKLDFYTRIP